MNSAFRTIDLGTFILAPVLVGQLMTFLSPVAAAGFMAGWNVVSLAVEYWLLIRVYRSVPQLARPKSADSPEQAQTRPPDAVKSAQPPAEDGPPAADTQREANGSAGPSAGPAAADTG